MGARGRLAVLLVGALLVAVACTTSSSPGTSPSRTIPRRTHPRRAARSRRSCGTVASVDPAPKPSPVASPGKTPKPTAKPAKTPAPKPSPSPRAGHGVHAPDDRRRDTDVQDRQARQRRRLPAVRPRTTDWSPRTRSASTSRSKATPSSPTTSRTPASSRAWRSRCLTGIDPGAQRVPAMSSRHRDSASRAPRRRPMVSDPCVPGIDPAVRRSPRPRIRCFVTHQPAINARKRCLTGIGTDRNGAATAPADA